MLPQRLSSRRKAPPDRPTVCRSDDKRASPCLHCARRSYSAKSLSITPCKSGSRILLVITNGKARAKSFFYLLTRDFRYETTISDQRFSDSSGSLPFALKHECGPVIRRLPLFLPRHFHLRRAQGRCRSLVFS